MGRGRPACGVVCTGLAGTTILHAPHPLGRADGDRGADFCCNCGGGRVDRASSAGSWPTAEVHFVHVFKGYLLLSGCAALGRARLWLASALARLRFSLLSLAVPVAYFA